MRSPQYHTKRRGVVLLLVLGIMAMFGMVALAYVLITGHSKREAKSYQRAQEYPITPQQQLRDASLQLFRGSTSTSSALREHSLLEDLYGRAITYGNMRHLPAPSNPNDMVTAVQLVANGQLIGFTPANATRYYPDPIGQPDLYEDIFRPLGNPGQFVGRVLVMRGGLASRRSTRIVGYDSANNLLLMLPFEHVPSANFVGYLQSTGESWSYTINGTPFSGTGFGYDSNTGNLDFQLPILDPLDPLVQPQPDPSLSLFAALSAGGDERIPYALLPNRAGDPSSAETGHLDGAGRANEDYDAPDYQNLALAAMLPDGNVPIPSFHRPALINYWYERIVAEWLMPVVGISDEADAWRILLQPDKAIPAGNLDASQAWVRDAILAFKRRIFFRPLNDLHGNFVGSSLWSLWRAQNIFDTNEYPGLAEVKGEYWLGQNVRPGKIGGVGLFGPWDVDNDGDGKPDGIWMDLGFPVRTANDGRRYKPLVSFLCVDLDGRLNVNAHGCLAHVTDLNGDGTPDYLQAANSQPYPLLFGGGTTSANVPRGQGNGPPEVSLAPVLDDIRHYRWLLAGKEIDPDPNRLRWVDGRYGEAGGIYVRDDNGDQSPDDLRYVGPGASHRPLSSGREADELDPDPLDPVFPYLMVRSDDPLSRNKLFEYYYLSTYGGAFGTPPDLKGSMAVGLDLFGQPMYWPLPDEAVSSFLGGQRNRFAWPAVNDPYELNLSRSGAWAPTTYACTPSAPLPGVPLASRTDHPFSVYELERLVRRFDLDAAALPDRLETLTRTLPTDQSSLAKRRNEITTESWDLPCPNLALPGEMVAANATLLPLRHVTDLLRRKNIATEDWEHFLPREMLAGLRMDLNRPFGNGVDDNDNGRVDEPGRIVRDTSDPSNPNPPFVLDPSVPSEIGESLPTVDAQGKPIAGVPFDHANSVDVNRDGNPNGAINEMADRAMARQLYARHLFILAMLLLDDQYQMDMTPDTIDETNSLAERRELTIRRLAQWAVNMADFRDADSAMTPFEYDVDPFVDNDPADEDGDGEPFNDNPWNVDGVIDDDPTRPGSDDRRPWRRLVWGSESPKLLLGECAAFHDRRLVDSALDDGAGQTRFDSEGNEQDNDLDSARIPQGSAFFELQCTGNPNNDVAPGELYTRDPNTGEWYLDLGRMAPIDSATGLSYPVWRIVISESSGPQLDPELDPEGNRINSVLERLRARPDSVAIEPEQYVNAPAPSATVPSDFTLLANPSSTIPPNVEIERIVWFTRNAPTTHEDADRIYYCRNVDSPRLRRGAYAVVGPRPITAIGSYRRGVTPPGSNTPIDQYGSPSPHAVRLWPQVRVTDNGFAAGIECYPYPDTTMEIQPALGIVVAANPPTSWTNVANTAPYGIGISVSEPLPSASYYAEPAHRNDDYTAMAGYQVWDAYGDLAGSGDPFRDTPQDNDVQSPVFEDGLLATGTYHDYRSVFLQRLADPNQPYHPRQNPYITVDWTPMDLTVFNGDDYDGTWNNWDPDDPNPDNPQFETRQWGGAQWNLWAREPDASRAPDEHPSNPATPYSGAGPLVFEHNLVHTLGYLNEQFHDPSVMNPPFNSTRPWITASYNNAPNPAIPPRYYGAPAQPFPWLAWNNRPFANRMELLQVPASSSARLLFDFTLANPTTSPYRATTDLSDPRSKTPFLPFGHLLNPFHSSRTSGESAHFHRMLEYVHVPSRFVGVDTAFNPAPGAFGDFTNPETRGFRPPFHRVSHYREPGRVNLNTIFSENVWAGLTAGSDDYPAFSVLQQSRRGYGGDIWALDPQFPTRFANPFRSFGGSYLVPTGELYDAVDGEVHTGLLRGAGLPHGDANELPLFDRDSQEAFQHTHRNPYFRYQLLHGLGATTTTRSNVYAVWVTVGYFEVLPASRYVPDQPPLTWRDPEFQAVFPAGDQLGPELGSDTGDVKRHRAFYIFDRSIPVGFERGRNNNVEDAILLERFIE